MRIWDKTRSATSKVLDGAADVVDHVTGSALVREAERFHREMEAVYAALVTRLVTAEQKIERLERQRTWAIGIAVVAIVISGFALLLGSR